MWRPASSHAKAKSPAVISSANGRNTATLFRLGEEHPEVAVIALARLHANKPELLMVLERPENFKYSTAIEVAAKVFRTDARRLLRCGNGRGNG
jgi:hypothetical protein